MARCFSGIKLFIFLELFFLSGCQLAPPTKIIEKHQYDFGNLIKSRKDPIAITPDSIIIDARSFFNYSLAHLPESIWINWEDFLKSKESHFLKEDLKDSAIRLARLGISKDSRLIIVGDGLRGNGEEGRLAWTFLYMGIKEIQIVNINYFKIPLTQRMSQPRKNSLNWEPEIISSIDISKKELLKILTAPTTDTILIDVRPEKEYLSDKSGRYNRVQHINIPWNEFIDENGRAHLKIKDRFEKIGITNQNKIIVLSQEGVKSALAAMALLYLGFVQVTHFAGGLEVLNP